MTNKSYIVDAPSLEVFKAKVGGPWTTWSSGCYHKGWNWVLFEVPSNWSHFVIPQRLPVFKLSYLQFCQLHVIKDFFHNKEIIWTYCKPINSYLLQIRN